MLGVLSSYARERNSVQKISRFDIDRMENEIKANMKANSTSYHVQHAMLIQLQYPNGRELQKVGLLVILG